MGTVGVHDILAGMIFQQGLLCATISLLIFSYRREWIRSNFTQTRNVRLDAVGWSVCLHFTLEQNHEDASSKACAASRTPTIACLTAPSSLLPDSAFSGS